MYIKPHSTEFHQKITCNMKSWLTWISQIIDYFRKVNRIVLKRRLTGAVHSWPSAFTTNTDSAANVTWTETLLLTSRVNDNWHWHLFFLYWYSWKFMEKGIVVCSCVPWNYTSSFAAWIRAFSKKRKKYKKVVCFALARHWNVFKVSLNLHQAEKLPFKIKIPLRETKLWTT